MKIIVLNISNYKEKDAIVTAINDKQLITFRVRGLKSQNSPLIWLNNTLTEADAEFVDDKRSKYLTLKDAKLVASPLGTTKNTLEKMCAINLATEVINRVVQDEDKKFLFPSLDGYIQYVEKEKDYLLAELIFLAKVIKIIGAELNVDGCVYCGSKSNIVAFSFEEGGFVCKDCVSKETAMDLSPIQMQLIRFIFKTPDYSYLPNDKVNEEDKKFLLKKLQQYIYDSIGINLSTIDLILNSDE